MKKYFYVFFLTSFLVACNQPTTGCLDPRATNFDVTADEGCSDCCTFPKLQFVTNSFWDTLKFSTFSKYRLTNGDSCQILSWKILISNIELLSETNKIFRVTDTITLYRPTEAIKALQDFGISTFGQTDVLNFGSFQAAGKFKKISFDIGLSAIANGVVASKMSAVSPLSNSSAMYIDSLNGFNFQKLQIRRVAQGDTLNLNLRTITRVHIEKIFTLKEGFAAAIPISVKLERLLQNVNLNVSENLILQKILENTPYSFDIQ